MLIRERLAGGSARVATIALLALCLHSPGAARASRTTALPAALSDADYWRLVETLSEPEGYFQSENLVGNERALQHVVPALHAMKRGGVYLGVAPDQNFTYIVALEPGIAFIIDIRRGNLLQHLMYKAIIELSPDRAAFLSRLFSRPVPAGLDEHTPVQSLLSAFGEVEGDPARFAANLEAIRHQLTAVHQFGLSADDLSRVARIYEMFFRFGPALSYSPGTGRNTPTYAEMQAATDLEGRHRAYLATETNYRWLRAFQQKNLLVPIVGDFAGPTALRAVGAYLERHAATVTAFYTSNVEQYLFRSDAAGAFYRNVATLPMDEDTVFIRSASQRNVLDPMRELLRAFADGRILQYWDLTSRGVLFR
jgi:hypothetical protein